MKKQPFSVNGKEITGAKVLEHASFARGNNI